MTFAAHVVRITPDGVLRFEYDGDVIDLPTARALLAAGRVALGDDVRPHPTLVVLHRAVVDRAARRYFAYSADARETTLRVAIVANNPVARVIGNFFVGLNRPDVPTRLFGDEASAVAWLLDRAAIAGRHDR